MCFHCFGAKISDSFRLCSLLPFLHLSAPPCSPALPRARSPRGFGEVGCLGLRASEANPGPPMAWVPFFV